MKKRIFKAAGLLSLASVLFISCGKTGLVITDSSSEGMKKMEDTQVIKEEFAKENDAYESGEDVICVYVCGAVRSPGIVNLYGEPRICDALEAAGGFAPGAKEEEINLAQKVSDGQKIRFPYEGEEGSPEKDSMNQEMTEDGLVNINTADEKGLTAIPGIGETRARAIVEYRDRCGKFQKIEDIMRVSGIKEGTFEKIKAYIKI